MAHSIRTSGSAALKHHKSDAHSLFSRYVHPVVQWLPKKYSDYQQINVSLKDLEQLEDKIYHYKMHWDFSKHVPFELEVSSGENGPSYSKVPSKDYLTLDDLDEAVRAMIFKINNYSFSEKIFDCDAEKLAHLTGDYRRELETMIERIESHKDSNGQPVFGMDAKELEKAT